MTIAVYKKMPSKNVLCLRVIFLAVSILFASSLIFLLLNLADREAFELFTPDLDLFTHLRAWFRKNKTSVFTLLAILLGTLLPLSQAISKRKAKHQLAQTRTRPALWGDRERLVFVDYSYTSPEYSEYEFKVADVDYFYQAVKYDVAQRFSDDDRGVNLTPRRIYYLGAMDKERQRYELALVDLELKPSQIYRLIQENYPEIPFYNEGER